MIVNRDAWKLSNEAGKKINDWNFFERQKNTSNVEGSPGHSYLDLFVGCDSTEHNLCEALSGEHPKTDASNDAAIFNEG